MNSVRRVLAPVAGRTTAGVGGSTRPTGGVNWSCGRERSARTPQVVSIYACCHVAQLTLWVSQMLADGQGFTRHASSEADAPPWPIAA